MLKHTAEYRAAIVAPERRIAIRASVDLTDPDIQYLPVQSSGEAPWSRSEQLHDKVMDLPVEYATLERGRWLLNGTQRLIPDDAAAVQGQVGFVSSEVGTKGKVTDAIHGILVSGGGRYEETVAVDLPIQNVDVLQTCTVVFNDNDIDGTPVSFSVSILRNGEVQHTEEFRYVPQKAVTLTDFTVYNPDTIRVSIKNWSVPGRRARIVEIIPGAYENWDGRMIANLSVSQNGDISSMALPYNTCQLVLDNHDKRFEPRKKDNLFQSIEERMGIGIEIGVMLPDGNVEYKKVGVFYQKAPGWTTSDNGVTITWNLVDIIGLISERLYVAPEVLPTTLDGWISSIVSLLGENFASRYRVDPNYADLPVTANDRVDVAGKTCGDLLRWACQATGTWPRAAADTGFLTVEPLWSEGNKVTLRAIEHYPTMRANPDIAMLVFQLYDGNGTQITVPGTSASSGDSKTISNPFIHTQEQALSAARMILSTYGGNRIETVGRGDPASEIGDVDTVWLDESSATTGRRISQTFEVQDGFLQNCKSVLLQGNGSLLYEDSVLLTRDGTWTAPAGVTRLFVAIGQGGQGGMKGQDGILEETEGAHINQQGNFTQRGSYHAANGAQGAHGSGGKIWFGTIDINDQQSFRVSIGQGGAPSDAYGVPGAEGGETTFGAYTSASGKVYPLGYTDITSGSSYGRAGVLEPLGGSADGGAGGEGGEAGIGGWGKASMILSSGRKLYYTYWDPKKAPGKGKIGKAGASGFVLIYWDKDEVTA